MPRYSIRKNRIKNGSVTGFRIGEDGSLTFNPEYLYHLVFLKGLDSTVKGSEWGRISLLVNKGENTVYSIYALTEDDPQKAEELDGFLTDPGVDAPQKLSRLKRMGAKRFAETDDALVYDVSGRFLYLAIEASGTGPLTVSDIVVDSTGDNFMNAFPQVYHDRNSFFHRYLSVFSSIYNDFQREIDSLPKILDLDTCSEEQLLIYGQWLGIELREGLLPTEVMRRLLKEGYELNRMKGTREAIERVLTIILGEKPVIIEHNQVRALQQREDFDLPPQFSVRGLYDVSILVKRKLTEELRHQVFFLLEQFKPVRTRFTISQMDERATADSNSYLDVNTVLSGISSAAKLDDDSSVDGIVVLK